MYIIRHDRSKIQRSILHAMHPGAFELGLITGTSCFIKANNDEPRPWWFLEQNALLYPANFPRANTWPVCTVNYTKVFSRGASPETAFHYLRHSVSFPFKENFDSIPVPVIPFPLHLFADSRSPRFAIDAELCLSRGSVYLSRLSSKIRNVRFLSNVEVYSIFYPPGTDRVFIFFHFNPRASS